MNTKCEWKTGEVLRHFKNDASLYKLSKDAMEKRKFFQYEDWKTFVEGEGIKEWKVGGIRLNDPQLDEERLFVEILSKWVEEEGPSFDERAHF